MLSVRLSAYTIACPGHDELLDRWFESAIAARKTPLYQHPKLPLETSGKSILPAAGSLQSASNLPSRKSWNLNSLNELISGANNAPNSLILQILCKIFRHALGQRCQPPLPAVNPVFNLTQEVVDLTIGGTHKFWINYPVGRITCTTRPSEISSSQSPGVAETNIHWFSQNSSAFKGRLSAALGKRNPCSIRTFSGLGHRCTFPNLRR